VCGSYDFLLWAFLMLSCLARANSVGTDQHSNRWDKGNVLTFDSRSSWGAPQTISLRLSETSEDNSPSADGPYPKEVGFCWVDLASMWKQESDGSATVSCQVWSSDAISNFDEHGDLYERPTSEVSVFWI
jgi:hypothetical protein